ncbi:MAG: hypothetical protein IT196_10450 [Acidimicrobiales bacterium]|nr:hypothetical protein [Acidimicrobiales bacterium]
MPTHVPVLGRGKHRSARRGACFMEMASYLAGERWSDHPRCTHPLLASVARLVNDNTADDDRQLLAPLIPSVIGLRGDDPHWDVAIARRALTTALPVAPEVRQRTICVGLLSCERVLDQLDGRPAGTLSPLSRDALASAPRAWDWARCFSTGRTASSLTVFRRRAAPAMVIISVGGIVEAQRTDCPAMLRGLLAAVITDCTDLAASPPTLVAGEQPVAHRRPKVATAGRGG